LYEKRKRKKWNFVGPSTLVRVLKPGSTISACQEAGTVPKGGGAPGKKEIRGRLWVKRKNLGGGVE